MPTPQMRAEGRDFDRFDEFCDHLLVVDRETLDEDGQPSVVGTYRFMLSEQAAKAGGFYTAGEFDIAPMLAMRCRRRARARARTLLHPQGLSHPSRRRCSCCGTA